MHDGMHSALFAPVPWQLAQERVCLRQHIDFGAHGARGMRARRGGEEGGGELAERGLLLLNWRRHSAQSSAPGAVERREHLAGRRREAL